MPAQRTAPTVPLTSKFSRFIFAAPATSGANDRNETSKDDRELSVFGKEGLSLCHLLLINPFNRAVIDLIAKVVPYGVGHGVPETGAEGYGEERTKRVEDAGCTGSARDKDKRIAGEQGANDDSGL